MKGFILHGKAAEMIFLRFAPKNRPRPTGKAGRYDQKEGLAALLCILLYVSGLFGFPNIVSLSFLGHIMDFLGFVSHAPTVFRRGRRVNQKSIAK